MSEISKNYGKWTLKQLVAELKKRQAKTSGKKAELVQRLRDYDELFIQVDTEQDDQFVLNLPSAEYYRDVNSSHDLLLDENYYELFLRSIDGKINAQKGIKMYNDCYLLSLRKALVNNETFLCARVASEYRKAVEYTVHIQINQNCISHTQCECAAGKGPFAACKHVAVALEAMKDFLRNKCFKTRPTCTEKLQTFHQAKKYNGSPVRAKHLKLKNFFKLQQQLLVFDPRPIKSRKNPTYQSNFRNQCINFAALTQKSFPELQLFQAANLVAFYNDHDYFELHAEDRFLNEMSITYITIEKQIEIEVATRGQSQNRLWLQERSKRLNSSCFGEIIFSKNYEKTAKKLISLQDISYLPALNHGKVYESHAIKSFELLTNNRVHLCGTFVSLEYPFLAASPDGIIDENQCIEIKCPFSAKDDTISPETVNYIYLCDKEGVYKLKENHHYYYQIQGQLFCADKQMCMFIIYTLKDILIISIQRDDSFIKKMIDRLKEFFEHFYKKEILNKYFYRN